MINVLNSRLSQFACLCLVLALGALPAAAAAMPADRSPGMAVFAVDAEAPHGVTQRNCTSLSQAVEQVRRRGNVERVISAQTRVSGGREVHHIKVLTKDGKVRTHTVNGCKRR